MGEWGRRRCTRAFSVGRKGWIQLTDELKKPAQGENRRVSFLFFIATLKGQSVRANRLCKILVARGNHGKRIIRGQAAGLPAGTDGTYAAAQLDFFNRFLPEGLMCGCAWKSCNLFG